MSRTMGRAIGFTTTIIPPAERRDRDRWTRQKSNTNGQYAAEIRRIVSLVGRIAVRPTLLRESHAEIQIFLQGFAERQLMRARGDTDVVAVSPVSDV